MSLFEKTSSNDINSVITELTRTIFQDNLIYTINQVNYLLRLEEVYPSNKIFQIIKHITRKIYNILKSHINQTIPIIIATTILLIFYNGKFNLTLQSATQQTVSLALLSAVATFAGFAVVFIQLSFDNYKKYYGAYSKILLFKSLGREIVVLFCLNILIDLLTAVVQEKYIFVFQNKNILHVQEYLFLLGLSFFVYFLILLLHKVKYIFAYSLSNNDLQQTIKSSSLMHIKDNIKYSKDYNQTNLILKSFEENTIEITIEILLNHINQNNNKIAEIILVDLTKHFQKLIENNCSSDDNTNVSEISIVYCKIMHKVIDSIYTDQHSELIIPFLENLKSFNYTASVYNCNRIAVNNLLTLINSTINLINKKNNINNILEGIECFKEIAFLHIYHNAPSWNDVQSGSIALYRSREHIFYSTRQYLNILWHFNITVFYNIIYEEITKQKDLSLDISYRILTIYRDFLHKNIIHNSKKKLREIYIKNLSSLNISLYKLLFNKLIEKDIDIDINLRDISHFSPFNMLILDSSIKYEDPQISNLLLNDYLNWCDFVIENYKYTEFTSILIGEVTGLMYIILIHLDELNNIEDNTKGAELNKERLILTINNIIIHFHEFNYSNNNKDRNIISVINSRFWNFKEFDLKNIKSVDGLFIDKIDQIISNTVWANTYENNPPNNQSKIPQKRFINFTLKMISMLFR